MSITKHDKIAKEIAEKKGVKYNSDKGIDIKTSTQAIEVEVGPGEFHHGTS